LINEHQLMDALQAQAATGGRLGTLLVKRGCVSEEQLGVVLATQNAMRASPLALDMSVIVTPVGDDIQDVVRFAVGLTIEDSRRPRMLPEPPVRAQQSLMADLSRRTSVCALSSYGTGSFKLRAGPDAEIPYRVSLVVGLAASSSPLRCG
tara:strand:+ start:5136 stop:5585 length:450 start_codon:yes stop_codon:yes gene_type:complete